MTMRWTWVAAAAFAAAAPVGAQSPGIGEAIAAGQVGERYDGYMAVIGSASPQLTRRVNAVNLRRRNLYIQLSARRNVSPDLVGMAAGCQLLSQLAVGEAYMLTDHVWRRRAPAEAIRLPDYCR
jgi:uncharacterized protein YdbL (DUF1318 family)